MNHALRNRLLNRQISEHLYHNVVDSGAARERLPLLHLSFGQGQLELSDQELFY